MMYTITTKDVLENNYELKYLAVISVTSANVKAAAYDKKLN